jgi:hypothetical protein
MFQSLCVPEQTCQDRWFSKKPIERCGEIPNLRPGQFGKTVNTLTEKPDFRQHLGGIVPKIA